jgi:dCMP deaminase
MSRISWDDYFFDFAELASKRSTCLRRTVGAVLVKDKMVVATGYNGPPRGLPHCSETGCIRQDENVPSGQRHELCRGLHAEQNAIIQAAKSGVNINGAHLYCSTKPCAICTKMIINAGIKKVFYKKDYNDEFADKLAKQSDVEFIKVK